MSNHEEQASLYVAGALPPEERRAFEAQMRNDRELAKLVRALQSAMDLFAVATAPLTLPAPDLREKILRKIDAGRNSSSSDHPGVSRRMAPGFNFHAATDERGWKELPVRGAWLKLLALEKERGYAVLMGKLEPGVRYPAHSHEGAEELFIVSGDLHIGDRKLGPGDFHHADAGTSHAVNYSEEGCTLIAVLPAEHELVQFAMEK